MNAIQLITLGLFFAIKLSTARYLLVEIEDEVEGEITEHAGSFINFQIDKLPIPLSILVKMILFQKPNLFTNTIRFNL